MALNATGQSAIFAPGSRAILNNSNFTVHINTKPHSTQDEESAAFRKLREKSCLGAAFNSDERYDCPKCHPHTREAIQTNICNWVGDCHIHGCFTRILWLYGPAGAGKSAIVQSVAETLSKQSKLAASFFFSRTAGGNRGHERTLIKTIAYQLCQSFPPVRPYIEQAIRDNPSIFDIVLSEQATLLLIHPLQQLMQDSPDIDVSTAPRTIIIDGLDECKDEAAQMKVLAALDLLANQDTFPFAILVASRPEIHIKSWFDLKLDAKDTPTSSIFLEDDPNRHDDIRRFFRESIYTIRHTHPFRHLLPPGWPEDSLIEYVVRHSSGQFIFAATVIRYIKALRDLPSRRLQHIVDRKSVRRQQDNPYAELDELYRFILSNSTDFQELLPILALAMANSCNEEYIGPERLIFQHLESFLDLALPLEILLSHINSILNFTSQKTYRCDSNTFIFSLAFYHASMTDFLADKDRSGDFYVDTSRWNPELFQMASRKFRERIPELMKVVEPSSYDDWLFGMVWYLIRNVSLDIANRELQLWATLDNFTIRYLVKRFSWGNILRRLSDDANKLIMRSISKHIFHKPLHSMTLLYSVKTPFPHELLVICQYGTYSLVMEPLISCHVEELLKDRFGSDFHRYFTDDIYKPLDKDWSIIRLATAEADSMHSWGPYFDLSFSAEQYTAAALFYLKNFTESIRPPLGQKTIQCHSSCSKVASGLEKSIPVILCPPFLKLCQLSTRLASNLRTAGRGFPWSSSYHYYFRVYDFAYEAECNGDPDQILAGGRRSYDVALNDMGILEQD